MRPHVLASIWPQLNQNARDWGKSAPNRTQLKHDPREPPAVASPASNPTGTAYPLGNVGCSVIAPGAPRLTSARWSGACVAPPATRRKTTGADRAPRGKYRGLVPWKRWLTPAPVGASPDRLWDMKRA